MESLHERQNNYPRILAVIPARGGSKRIPHKNTRSILGVPAIAYAIKTAKHSFLFKDIIVSTDDRETARLAKYYGGTVPFMRPPELADSQTPIADVMKHAVEYFTEQGYNPDIVCCIYPVTPMLETTDLIEGYKLIRDNPALDFVFGAVKCDSRIARAFTVDPVKMLSSEFYPVRTQDLPSIYCDAGMFYFGRVEVWREKRGIFDKKSGIIEIPEERGIDIDTEDDWAKMEHAMCERYYSERRYEVLMPVGVCEGGGGKEAG